MFINRIEDSLPRKGKYSIGLFSVLIAPTGDQGKINYKNSMILFCLDISNIVYLTISYLNLKIFCGALFLRVTIPEGP